MSNLLATREDILYAYRLILGREPDSEGLRNHERAIRTRPISARDLARYFLGSAEFASAQVATGNPVLIDVEGYGIHVRSDDLDIGATIAKGEYEPHVASVVKELLHPGDTFVDVGANIGFFAAMAASIVGATGRVFAVEPMDKNVQLIAATAWKNGFDNIEIIPYAASDRGKIVGMSTNANSSNGEIVREDGAVEAPRLFALTRRLDDVLGKLDRIDLIKFDIEGYEMPAWKGFAEGMARCRPNVLTEFHPKCIRENAGVDPLDYLDVLFDYGDRVEVLLGADERQKCSDPAEVMIAWEIADRRLRTEGTTHLDLFVKPKSP